MPNDNEVEDRIRSWTEGLDTFNNLYSLFCGVNLLLIMGIIFSLKLAGVPFFTELKALLTAVALTLVGFYLVITGIYPTCSISSLIDNYLEVSKENVQGLALTLFIFTIYPLLLTSLDSSSEIIFFFVLGSVALAVSYSMISS